MNKFKLRHGDLGKDYPIQFFYKEDHTELNVGEPGSNYVRRWKNHVSFYFSDMFISGTKNDNYRDDINNYIEYFTKLDLKFNIVEKVHKAKGYYYTLIKLSLDQVEILY